MPASSTSGFRRGYCWILDNYRAARDSIKGVENVCAIVTEVVFFATVELHVTLYDSRIVVTDNGGGGDAKPNVWSYFDGFLEGAADAMHRVAEMTKAQKQAQSNRHSL